MPQYEELGIKTVKGQNDDGSVPVQLSGSNGEKASIAQYNSFDNNGAVDYSLAESAFLRAFNGSQWDRVRNNTEGTLLASAVRNSTTNSSKQTNYNGRGINVYLNITANPNDAAQKLTIFVREYDPISGLFKVIGNLDVIGTSSGLQIYKIYPGISEATDKKSSNLGRSFDIQIYHTGVGSWTYSLGYSLTL